MASLKCIYLGKKYHADFLKILSTNRSKTRRECDWKGKPNQTWKFDQSYLFEFMQDTPSPLQTI